MLDDKQKERLRNKTVEVILVVRAAYLRTPNANVLKHWDQLQSRIRAAARTTSSPEEWVTCLSRTLQLSAPNVECSSATCALADDVHELGAASEWLQLVEDEYGYLLALTRSVAEKRKTDRQEDAHV
jgi:hypothetical protein